MAMNYVQEFKEMISRLRRDPKISVVSSCIFPPASEADLDMAAEIMSCKLEKSLREFYEQCNGIQLRWIRRDSEDFNEAEFGMYSEGPVSHEDIVEDDDRMDGCINIRPILEVVRKNVQWQMVPHKLYVESYTIEGELFSPLEFCANAQVWDAVSVTRGVVLFPLRKSDTQVCMLSSLRYGTCEDSAIAYPAAYLRFLLESEGSNFLRTKVFRLESGISKPILDGLPMVAHR